MSLPVQFLEMHPILPICSESLCPLFRQGLAFHRRKNDHTWFHTSIPNQSCPFGRKNRPVWHTSLIIYLVVRIFSSSKGLLGHENVPPPRLSLLRKLTPQVRHLGSPDPNLHAQPLEGRPLGQGLAQVDAVGRAHHFLNSAWVEDHWLLRWPVYSNPKKSQKDRTPEQNSGKLHVYLFGTCCQG